MIKEHKEDVKISGQGQSWLIQPWSSSTPVGVEHNVAYKATCLANASEHFLSVSKPAAP